MHKLNPFIRRRSGRINESKMSLRTCVVSMVLLALFSSPALHAQSQDGTDEVPFIRFSGSAVITGDIYTMDPSHDSTIRPRRPPNLWRFILTPTITIGDYLTLPFNIMLSSRETNTITSATRGTSFLQFLQNPGNNLGFLSISPRIGWAQFHLGTHVPNYSELSSGDCQVFGVGADLRPGRYRFSLSAGSTQRPVEPDSSAGIRGSYARWMYLAKLGYGEEETSHVDLNLVRSRDDPSSIQRRIEGIQPQEGTLASVNFRLSLSDALSVLGEGGVSYFTNEMRAGEYPDPEPVLDFLQKQRISSRIDYAGALAVQMSEKDWGVKAQARYIGPGYVALGYPFHQADRLEFSLSPRLQLFESRLSIQGTVGNRVNNLSETKAETSSQFMGACNLLAAVSERFTVSAAYSNFGVRNNTTQDTLKIETVSHSFNLSPTYTIPSDAADHTVSVTYSQDTFNDFNVVSGAENSNITQSIFGLYSVTFTGFPLSLSASYNYLTNDLKPRALTLNSASVNTSYRTIDPAITTSLTLTHSSNRLTGYTSDVQWLLRIAAKWQISRMIALGLSASRNMYEYGSSKPGVSFQENLLQTSITTRF